MLHTNKFVGGTLLVAGTSIGGGMLLIPVMCSFAGFTPSLFLLGFVWFFMLVTAFLFLEVNLAIPGEINLVTMAETTLGKTGKVVSWVTYLLLLYSLLAAYIAGSKTIFADVSQYLGFEVSDWVTPLPLLAIFGVFIYLGTRTVDYVNRLLMLGLIVTYFIIAFFLPSYVDYRLLAHVDVRALIVGVPLLFTSYGFHIIIPSLTNYMERDRKKLSLTLFVGSLIPLFIYILWQFLILGTVPLYGEIGLAAAWLNGEASTQPLMQVIKSPVIATTSRFFAFFALITSFLGVSLSLASFLRDGLKIKKDSLGRLGSCLLTFIPPLFFVYFYEKGFMLALQYAAVFVVILLVIMPALMTWKLKEKSFWSTALGRLSLLFIILVGVLVILIDIAEELGYLKYLVTSYLPMTNV